MQVKSPVDHDQVLEGWFVEGQAQWEGLEQGQQGGALAGQRQTLHTLQAADCSKQAGREQQQQQQQQQMPTAA